MFDNRQIFLYCKVWSWPLPSERKNLPTHPNEEINFSTPQSISNKFFALSLVGKMTKNCIYTNICKSVSQAGNFLHFYYPYFQKFSKQCHFKGAWRPTKNFILCNMIITTSIVEKLIFRTPSRSINFPTTSLVNERTSQYKKIYL